MLCYSTARALSPCVRPLTVPTATFPYRGYGRACVRVRARKRACKREGRV